MTGIRRVVLAGAVAVLTAAGLLWPATADAATSTVTTVAFTFVTPVTSIAKGDSLVLSNGDVAPHNITSDTPGLFGSATAAPNTSQPVTGVETLAPGTYTFNCSIHPFMHGALEVGLGSTGGGGLPNLPVSLAGAPSVGVVPTPTSVTVYGNAVYSTSYVTGAVYRQAISAGGALGPAKRYAWGFSNPLGITFGLDGLLFVSDSHPSATPGRTTAGRVWRLPPGRGGDVTKVGAVVIDELPNGRHNTNGLDYYGTELFITNGSSTDDGVSGGEPEQPLSGTLLAVPIYALGLTPSSPQVRVVARGMRNVYDVVFKPRTGSAWLTMNGPDMLAPYGEDLLLNVDATSTTVPDFGFPGCVYASPPTTPTVKQNPAVVHSDVCDGTQTAPKALLGLHVSADGAAFGPAASPWFGGIYIAEFGNFFGNNVVGHRIVRVAVNSAGVVGAQKEVMKGGLPLDVTFGSQGMYIADFALGILFIPNAAAPALLR
jgi:glucose/arabinose dehydrogenase